MARIKANPTLNQLVGKIGGQNFIKSTRGNFIRNITQTNKFASTLQSSQRKLTYDLMKEWTFLSQAVKNSWVNASTDYSYINKKGSTVQRTGFHTFQFINQNRNILGLNSTIVPPTYEAVTTPIITGVSSGVNDLTIKTTQLGLNQTYALYANPYIGRSCAMQYGLGYYCGNISRTQLENGINIIPLIKSIYLLRNGSHMIGYYLKAIITANGNADQFPNLYQNTVVTINLDLQLSSYFPFDTDFNDVINGVTSTPQGTTALTTGLINGAINIPSTINNYLIFENTPLWNWRVPEINTPKSFCVWFKKSSTATACIFSNANTTSGGNFGQISILARASNITLFFWQRISVPRIQIDIGSNASDGNWHFLGVYYKNASDFYVQYDNLSTTTGTVLGTYVEIGNVQYEWWAGRYRNSASSANEVDICEFAFFNQKLSPTEFETIRQANLNGLTILDIT